MTGTLSMQTDGWGEAKFTDVRSVYRGDWYMMASSPGYDTAYTAWFTIATGNTAFSSISFALSQSTVGEYVSFSVTTTVKDSSGNAMLNPCPMSISESGGSTLYGSATSLTITGSTSFTFYFTTAGSKTLSASCYTTGTYPMTVSKNQLTITSISPVISIQPSNSLTPFSVEVRVYYYGTTTLVTSYGPYSVTLSLNPSGTLSGTLTGTTSSGIVSFSNLYILSRNTFTVDASSTDLLTGSSSTFFCTNYVKTMSVSIDNSLPTVLFNHVVTVLLYGDDGAAFTGSVAVSISSTSLTGTLSLTTSSGTATFSSVYFTLSGSEIITASVPASSPYSAVSATHTVTVNQPRLKITGTLVRDI
jgi:hypothetical protein